MTVKAFIKSTRDVLALKGQQCVRASAGYARTLLLDCGMLRPPDSIGYEEPEIGLVAECPWRLDSRTSVIVGSGDPEDVIDSRLQICLGKTVDAVEVFPPSYTLRVALSDGLTVWVFPDDSRDFVACSEYPRSSWYVAGFAVSEGWEC